MGDAANQAPLKRSNAVQDFTKIPGNKPTTSFGNKPASSFGSKPAGSFGSGTNFSFGKQAAAEKPIDPLIQRLNRIRDACTVPKAASNGFGANKANAPKPDAYRFSAIVYNVSTGKATPTPTGISQQNWEKELAKAKQYPMANSDPMVPAVLQGFPQLNNRIEQQSKIIGRMYEKLELMRSEIQEIRESYDIIFINLIQQISEKNREISEKLMTVLKKKEVEKEFEKEIEKEVDSPDLAFTPQEHELFDRLEKLENEISKPKKFKSALNALDLKSIMIRESNPCYPEVLIKDQTDEVEAIIKSNHEAISSLVKLIAKTQKSTSTLEKKYQEKIQTYIESFNSYT